MHTERKIVIVQLDQPSLQVGDLVKIHSLEEIESTLNHSPKAKRLWLYNRNGTILWLKSTIGKASCAFC